MKKQMLFGLAFTALYMQAGAQTMLDSVVIRENRIQLPFSKQNRDIRVLDKKQIAALPVKSVNELLSYVAGVDLRQRGPNGTQSDIGIDGSTFDQVLVLVNGVKMSDPQTGHHAMNLPVPLSAIDHIEVLRGPAAAAYGVNALTGAVNIVTRTPVANEIDATVYAGSNMAKDSATGDTYYGWGARATASLAGKKQGHIISVAHDEGNGYRYNTAFNAWRIFYQDRFIINKKNSIEAQGGYNRNDFGANSYYAAPVDVNSKETVQTATGSITYNYRPTSKISFRPRLSYRYNNDDYIFIRQNPSYYHNHHETNVVTGELQSTVQFRHGHMGIGVEYRNESINSNNLGSRHRDNTGIYGEYRHNFNAKLSAGAGVYVNNSSIYGWNMYPSADIGYLITKKWKLYANAGSGQRLPTYTDLYYTGPVNIGNPSLKPETAKFGQAGVRFASKSLSANAGYFYRRVSDFIDWIRANNNDPWQPQNYQSVNTQGITVDAQYALSNHLHMSKNYRLDMNAAYTYLDQQIVVPASLKSKYAIEALRHQLIAGVRSTFFKRYQLNVNARYQYRISHNDYTLLDARLMYLAKHWSVYGDVNNILNTQYKESGAVPLPGRWYTIGFNFNTKW